MVTEADISPDHQTRDSSWLDIALGSLAQRQVQYEGEDYVDEVERHAVYHREAATILIATTAVFLCNGTPRLKKHEIDSYLTDLRQVALDATRWQLDYIRTDCDGCPVHDWHYFWRNWRRMRQEGPSAEYRREVEFGCIYHQMIFNVSEMCLESLLRSRKYPGGARLLRGKKVSETIDQQIRRQVRQRTGIEVVAPEDAGKWTWRDTWGKKSDQIKSTLQHQAD
jgi:hypothetical protein